MSTNDDSNNQEDLYISISKPVGIADFIEQITSRLSPSVQKFKDELDSRSDPQLQENEVEFSEEFLAKLKNESNELSCLFAKSQDTFGKCGGDVALITFELKQEIGFQVSAPICALHVAEVQLDGMEYRNGT